MILFESPRSRITILLNPDHVRNLELTDHGMKVKMVEGDDLIYDITYADIEDEGLNLAVSKSNKEIIN